MLHLKSSTCAGGPYVLQTSEHIDEEKLSAKCQLLKPVFFFLKTCLQEQMCQA